MSNEMTGAGPVVRFGRSEQGRSGLLWSVYEALAEGDYVNGRVVASFVRREDALAFIEALPRRPEAKRAKRPYRGVMVPFSWSTLGGDHYSGYVTDVDSNVVYVQCEDGEERCTGGSEAELAMLHAIPREPKPQEPPCTCEPPPSVYSPGHAEDCRWRRAQEPPPVLPKLSDH